MVDAATFEGEDRAAAARAMTSRSTLLASEPVHPVRQFLHRNAKKGKRTTGVKTNAEQLNRSGGCDQNWPRHLPYQKVHRLMLLMAVFLVLSEPRAKIQNQFDAAVWKDSLRRGGFGARIVFKRPKTLDKSIERIGGFDFKVAHSVSLECSCAGQATDLIARYLRGSVLVKFVPNKSSFEITPQTSH